MPKIKDTQDIEELGESTQQYISEQNWLKALNTCCEACPPASKEAIVRTLAGGVFGSVLQAIPSDKIDKILADMEQPQRNLVMKYVYKAMGTSEECGKLLKWHKALTTMDGLGIICRAMADRKV